MRLVSAVLNSPSMYERSGELLDACFAKYSMKKVFCASGAEYAVPTDVPKKSAEENVKKICSIRSRRAKMHSSKRR